MSLPQSQRTALIVDCDPNAGRPVLLRPLDASTPGIALTRDEAQHLVDDVAHVLDLLDATAEIATAAAP
ncbi:hypothetical protein OG948_21175 [Embleya sp. NBC_00888]|uniref:hypothetical protein n=1 Tax=Embleya sp. NBC_00888 TaxID=2975960 RepID=UPI00386980D8|nr:hypothetical protein OG948_21175 [Embleya sp. NBC_00888]